MREATLTVALVVLLSGCTKSTPEPVRVHGTLSMSFQQTCDSLQLPSNLQATFRDEHNTVIGTKDFSGTGRLLPDPSGCRYESPYTISLPHTDFYDVVVSPEVPGMIQPPPESYDKLAKDHFRLDIRLFP